MFPDPRVPLHRGRPVPSPLAELATLEAQAELIREAAQECVCGGTAEIHVRDGRLVAVGDIHHTQGCPFENDKEGEI